jgi:hypothetical protein
MIADQRYYASGHWRKLSRLVKLRDGEQCQVCGDRRGDLYCVPHTHHIIPRSRGGPDNQENLITLCDLCHAVVTRRWHKPWFGELTEERKQQLEVARQEFNEFLCLEPWVRAARQALLWSSLGIIKRTPLSPRHKNVLPKHPFQTTSEHPGLRVEGALCRKIRSLACVGTQKRKDSHERLQVI